MAKKILVIDDEELVTESLLKLLSIEGYNATVAKSGEEAIDKVKKNDFDLIICDVRMPELDGIETIKRIRAHLENSNKKPVPEVLITGYADMEKYVSAKELEVFDYLYKPFDNKEFLRIIKNVLG
ncbi:MAG: response regulator [Candidatus Omnitrophica bacterium]|nr:response regulator [Candidatus Omnitrophota bacterium]MBU4473254.1 response regulator [Candidatus Omnitrophota bacterium]MCG2706060.1 response regulator [Candidatus Omnitrophota bacterium]